MHTFKNILIGGGIALLGFISLLGLAGLALWFTTRGDQSVPATVDTDPSLPQVEIDGRTFHAETFGDPANPVVVVVHGGPGGDYGYLLNLARLADDYFVVFYDQMGAGLSPRVSAEILSLQSSVDDLDRIVAHFGQGQPVRLIGHSWGAMLAAAYIGQHPDSVSQVVLAEPGALDNAGLARFSERQASSQSLAYYSLMARTVFESLHLQGPDAHAPQDYIFGTMSANFVNTAASGYQCEEGVVSAETSDVDVPPSRFGAVAYRKLFGSSADLSSIAAHAADYTNDVLFMASECNEFIGAEFQREQMGLFPQAELVVIGDAGHEMFGDNPAESIGAVRTFFQQ